MAGPTRQRLGRRDTAENGASEYGGCILRSMIVRVMSVLSLAAPLALCVIPSAQAQRSSSSASDRPWSTDGARTSLAPFAGSLAGRSSFSAPRAAQHEGLADHLPPAHENMQLVSKLELRQPFGNVLAGQIADVSVHKNTAYLMSWSPLENADDVACRRGGFFSVDIRNPAAPVQEAFIPALAQTYHGEGAHAITSTRPRSRATCWPSTTSTCAAAKGGGGFDLYDVTDPANPVRSCRAPATARRMAGPVQDPALVATPTTACSSGRTARARTSWPSDNTELRTSTSSTSPTRRDPEFINDLDLLELPEAERDRRRTRRTATRSSTTTSSSSGSTATCGCSSSYWDAGYVQLERRRPGQPDVHHRHRISTSRRSADGLDPPEGNAHQAEYSHDNQFFLAADEDFGAVPRSFARSRRRRTRVSPRGRRSARRADRARRESLAGDTVFVGYACTARSRPAGRRGDDRGRRARRRSRLPGEGRRDRGRRLRAGRSSTTTTGAAARRRCETLINMADRPADRSATPDGVRRARGRGIRARSSACHRPRGHAPVHRRPAATRSRPAAARAGASARAAHGCRRHAMFDGWGYAHLYDANTSEEIDAFAIPEALDARYASGFGDLTIHEFATDPETNLAYVSLLLGRLAGAALQPRGRLGAGRQVHRRRRQQLLGRRAVHRQRPATG